MLDLLVVLLLLIPVVFFVMALVALVRSNHILARHKAFEAAVAERLDQIESKLETLFSSAETVKEDRSRPASDADPASTETSDEDILGQKADDDIASAARQEAGEKDTKQEKVWSGFTAANENAKPQSSKPDLESQLGGRWSVLLGGFALALGIVFLVRHSIEAGYLGPGMRVLAGLLFSMLLFAVGEWLRRNDLQFNLPVQTKADIPGILTGAGACGLFASLYAAYGLYGFIGPATAFIALTSVGIITMLLSAVHGPKLAAIGILGAYGTPLLISSDNPNTLALAFHVLIVTAIVLTIAHIRNWKWLALSGFVISSLWTVLAATGGANPGISGVILTCGLTLMFAALFFIREESSNQDWPFEKTAGIAFGAIGVATVFQLAVNHQLPDTVTGLVVALTITGISVLRHSTSPVVVVACLVALFAILQGDLPYWVEEGRIQTRDYLEGLVPQNKSAFVQNALLISVPPALLALWGAWRSINAAPRISGWLASAVSTLAFFSSLILYMRLYAFETRPQMGAICILIAGAMAVATEALIRKEDENTKRSAPAAIAVGVVSVLSLAIAISLETGWLPLAFALTVGGIAYIYTKRSVKTLPWLAVVATAISGLAILANMPGVAPNVSMMYFFNELILLLGLPALLFLVSGQILQRAPNSPSHYTHGSITSVGLAIFALFVAFQLTHAINGGTLANTRYSLAEAAAYTLAGLGFAAGLQRIAKRSRQNLFDRASQIAGALSLLIAAIGLLGDFNPAFNNASVGEGYFFNLLLPGYLLTALASGGVTLLSRNIRPTWYVLSYATLSGALLFAYVSLMLRNAFQNPVLALSRPTTDLEFLLYSPLWLALGGLILTVGLRFHSRAIRAASGLVIALTIFKVFLLDMAELEGVLRALSFIGLGLTLIVIGRFYQRILTQDTKNEGSPTSQDHQ